MRSYLFYFVHQTPCLGPDPQQNLTHIWLTKYQLQNTVNIDGISIKALFPLSNFTIKSFLCRVLRKVEPIYL